MRQWEQEQAIRATRTPEEAVARNRRGFALVQAALNAALAGDPLPELPPLGRTTPAQPARLEAVACSGCYRPIVAPPGSFCDRCPSPTPAGEVSNG